MSMRTIVTLAVVGAVWVADAEGQTTERRSQPELKELVAAQVQLSVGLLIGEIDVQAFPEAVTFTHLGFLVDSISLLRATSAAAGHSAPFLLASDGKRTWMLGGFPSPEVTALSRALHIAGGDEKAYEIAKLFSRVADPNGATELLWPSDNRTGTIEARWLAEKPNNWPGDSIVCSEQSAYCIAQITVLSRAEWSGYGSHWEPIAYRFFLARNWEVLAWARRTGSPFGR